MSGFDFSSDGRWLVYRSGERGREQLYRLPADGLVGAAAEVLTHGDAGVEQWDFTPDGTRIYFARPDSFDEDEVKRVEKGFTVDVRNAVTPLSSLWSVEVGTGEERRETDDASYSVDSFVLSDDGRWIGITGGSPERYERNITASRLYADLYLKEVATGEIERLTDNYEVGEGGLSFSPDGRWIAFSAPDNMDRYTMTDNRVYIREVADRGGAFRKLGADFDQSSSVGFWSDDSGTIYFNAGVTVTTQLHALDVATGAVRQLTEERAALSVSRDDDTGTILIGYSDPKTPPTVFTVAGVDDVPNRSAWTQLVDVNPHVRDIALGEEVEINWRSPTGSWWAECWSTLSATRRGRAIRSSSRSTGDLRQPTSCASMAATAPRSTPVPGTPSSNPTTAARGTTATSIAPTSSATTSRWATRTSSPAWTT